MKQFTDDIDAAFQGDGVIVRVDSIPKDAVKRKDKTALHSETGHHHEFTADSNVFLYSTKDDLVQYLEVKSKPATLEHLRAFDTHESWTFPPGNYKIIRQRERSPSGWKRVED